MNENIKTIRLKSDFFKDELRMDLFATTNSTIKRAALIYGKNGSGKSTISNLFNSYKKNELNSNQKLEFLDELESDISTSIAGENIYCFNEEFIDENIKISADGIGAIVMLGKQIDVDKKITETKDVIIEATKEIKKINLPDYIEIMNSKCPEYHRKNIKEILNMAQGWADKDRDVKGNVGKSRVNDKVIENIMNSKNNGKVEDLLVEYDNNLKYLKTIQEYTEYLPEKFKKIILSSTIKDINSLLQQSVSRPLGNELVIRLDNSLKNHGVDRLNEIEESFNSDAEYCPYCLRDITEIEIKEIVKTINIIQNKDVKELESNLRLVKLEPIDLSILNPHKEICGEEVDKAKLIENSINNNIQVVNTLIDNRLKDIYLLQKPISFDFENILKKLNEIIGSIIKKAKKFNSDVKNSKSKKVELHETVNKIAYHGIKNHYSKFISTNTKKEQMEHKCGEFEELIKKSRIEIQNLESQKKRTDIALGIINNYLSIIFYDNERLKLEDKGGMYRVVSSGNIVLPNRLSTGERNAISLCYYFAMINLGMEKEKLFSNPLLLVIDDPITSYDVDNRIGIFTFLRSMIYKIMKTNDKSKLIVMTHKIDVFYDLEKTLNDSFLGKNRHYNAFELKEKGLANFEIENTYKSLLNDVFVFATSENEVSTNSRFIGNIMRRVLESFSTFNYSLDLNKLTNEDKILEKIEDKFLKEFFSNFMSRLLLNNESHMREIVSSIETNSFYQYIDYEEKKQTAKALLVFLYQLDDFHITQNLLGKSNVEAKMRQWSNEIKRLVS